MSAIRVPVIEKIFSANDRMARLNYDRLQKDRVFSVNLMASPGAGKTSFILQTINRIKGVHRVGVIEGDTAPVTIDADKIIQAGMPAVQINTGGDCHLDASMVSDGLDQLPLNELDLLIIENVGNLICPAAWDLGTDVKLLVASVPEGDDKPYKYPNIYRGLDVLVINKTDLAPYVRVDLPRMVREANEVRKGKPVLLTNCATGEGVDAIVETIAREVLFDR